jgi:hypothetical protein
MCCGAPALPGQEEYLLMLFLLFLHRRFRREKRRPHRSGPSFLLWNPRGRSPLVEPPLPIPFLRRPSPYVGFAVAPSPQGGTLTAESPLADRRCRFAVAPARCPLSVDHHRLVRLRRIPQASPGGITHKHVSSVSRGKRGRFGFGRCPSTEKVL